MISQDDKQFLEANRGHYNTAVNAGYVQDLGQDIKMRMVEIIKTYFAPAYLANLWCGPCIMDMVKYLYVQYDAMPIIKHETFPKHDESVIAEEKEWLKAELPTPKKKGGRKPKGK